MNRLIFIDFAKQFYSLIWDDCIRLLSEEGCIIADNVTMKKCKSFLEMILQDQRLKTKIIDLDDGISFSVRAKKSI